MREKTSVKHCSEFDSRPTTRSVALLQHDDGSSIITLRVVNGMSDQPKAGPRKTISESPISDVFEGRHPSNAEKDWAEKTLTPTLDKAPERPIGAPTGITLDEHGHGHISYLLLSPGE